MKKFNYLKNNIFAGISSKTWKIMLGVLGAGLLAGAVAFFTYFRVERVEVMGCSHYTQEEIKEIVLRGPLASNSVLAPLFYTKKEVSGIPLVDGYTVTRINRNTICISVKEKRPVGCIPFLGNYIYFDRNGYFVHGSSERDSSVPYFDGIEVKEVVLNEKLPIKGKTVLNTAVALSTIFKKNETIPDHICFDDNYNISLEYGNITVSLGKDENLEEKMSRVIAIMPKIQGMSGILHMESIGTNGNTFEAEQEEVTAENWNGGYDENGDYTGYGEYDENGNHVGPKPMTDLDYAIQAWKGGYDGEGDYTGAGEYDENGNYTVPKPTQELIDSFGDWKGGYLEDGSFVGYGEMDKDGNYVGPNPNASGSDGDDSSGDSSYGDSSYGDSSYGDSSYGDSSYGDSSYGDSSYGDSSYGDSSYGDSSYGNGYGEDGYYGESY